MKIEELRMLDVRAPKKVQIELSQNTGVLWVNVDGVCFLRVTDPKGINISLEGFNESHLG